MHFKVVWCLHYNWQPGTCKHRTTHRRRKQFHLGGGQRNIHVHCDRGDLRCMYEVVRVKLGIYRHAHQVPHAEHMEVEMAKLEALARWIGMLVHTPVFVVVVCFVYI